MAIKQKDKTTYIKERFTKLSNTKAYWDTMFDQIGIYVNQRHEEQTGYDTSAEWLTDKIWDTTAVRSSKLAAASILNSVYPSAKKTFKVKPSRFIRDTDVNKKYYRFLNDTFVNYLDDPKTNIYSSNDEGLLNKIQYGTSAIEIIESDSKDPFEELPVTTKFRSLRDTFIDEGEKGVVDTVYFALDFTPRQLVSRYGIDAVSKSVRKQYRSDPDRDSNVESNTIRVIQAVELASNIYSGKELTKKKKYVSIHMERDTNHILKESGFKYLPVIVSRFEKRSTEIWGRCPTIDGFPDILLANIMAEIFSMGVEKKLDPAYAVPDSGFLGSELNTSPGGVNVYSPFTGSFVGNNPIFPLYTDVDLREPREYLTAIRTVIQQHYFLDWLFDISAQRERTLGEVRIQNDLRGRALSTVYSREEKENIIPQAETIFKILFEKGYLGVVDGSKEHNSLLSKGIDDSLIEKIPEDIQELYEKGVPIVDFTFISPAANFRKQEELAGTQAFMIDTANVGSIFPNALAAVDIDNLIKRLAELRNVDVELLNSAETIQRTKEAQAQAAQQQQAIEQDVAASDIESKKAMANSQNAAAVRTIRGQ